MKGKGKRRRRGHKVLLLLVLIAAALFWQSNFSLQTEEFQASLEGLPEGFDGCRIVVLGDLHSADFGGENKDLLEAVERAGPEYIFLVGDLLDAFHEIPESYAERTARDLAAIAPTCYVTGNHEWAIGGVPELKETLAEQGVTVLSNTFTILQRGGDSILLAGSTTPTATRTRSLPKLWPLKYTPLMGTRSGFCWPIGTTTSPPNTASSARTWWFPDTDTAVW